MNVLALLLQTQIVMLGTGTPNPDPQRMGPAVAVVVNGSAYLFDAGAGLVRRAAEAEQRGMVALRQASLTHVFLTHLHSDHTLGLADLILTPWVLGRSEPLRVFGPSGTRYLVRQLLNAYGTDIERRQDGWQPQNRTGWQATGYDRRPGLVYQDPNVRVIAFLVEHGNWEGNAFGYRIETADRSIVISGDTRASEAIVRACNGCDVLIHEVYSDLGFATLDEGWRRYHGSFHTGAAALGELATRSRPGHLVLYHTLTWGGIPRERILDEVRATYTGQVTLAADLEIF